MPQIFAVPDRRTYHVRRDAAADARESMILSLAPIVLRFARVRYASAVLERSDLIGIAWIAAISAVDDFDPARGSLFAFAALRVRSAIRRALARHAQYDHRFAPALDTDGMPIDPDAVGTRDVRPDASVVSLETYRRLRDGLVSLKPRQRRIVLRHIFGRQPFRCIAKIEGVSAQRAHQIERDALDILRRHIA